MAKVKNIQIANVIQALNTLMPMDLPVGLALKLRDIHRLVEVKNEDISVVRTKVIEQYAQRDEKGEIVNGDPIDGQATVKIDESKKDEFNAAMKELYEKEFDAPVTLTASDFGSLSVKPMTLIQLGAFVEG